MANKVVLMNSAIAAEIARLEVMTINKVIERFESLFGEKCRSRNRHYLIRRIAWRLQANSEGGLHTHAQAYENVRETRENG